MTKAGPATIYEGVVAHRRFRPVEHRLRYRVFSFLLDLDRLEEVVTATRFFSLNRFNLFSIYARDHGAKKGERLVDHIRGVLARAGVQAPGRILMLAYPRMLGYVFNPLTVYYCYGEGDALAAILYEVRNTFGGRHCYLIPVGEGDGSVAQAADKVFHVSPFIDMEMQYRFTLSPPGDDISVVIGVHDREGVLLNASFVGEAHALGRSSLPALFARYPLMTLKVIAGIHWEAVKLLAKGLRLRPGAPTPEGETTVIAAARPGG